jgi:hypothetical protein
MVVMMKVVNTSDTSVKFYEIPRCNIPQAYQLKPKINAYVKTEYCLEL